MTELARHSETEHITAIALPEPRTPISIRQAVSGSADLQFIDALQKQHSKMVGWFPTRQIEANIEGGHVLIAEQANEPRVSASGSSNGSGGGDTQSLAHGRGSSTPLGYCIARDRYFKRDDVGIVYQLNIIPGKHRKLVGASLIAATFERSAYGCKLFSCWCAQDLQANHFWESIGFVPLAFRTGSRGRGKNAEPRIHIFWQKRIREGDLGPASGGTPYWFPSQTSGGAVRENRLILPIPPGTHWSDAKPAILPGMEKLGQPLLEAPGESEPRQRKPRRKKKPVAPAAAQGGLWFGPPPEAELSPQEKKAAAAAKRKAEKKPPQKNDPKLVAAARELKDRYLEEVNSGRMLPCADGKYDVSRHLDAAPSVFTAESAETVRLLDAA